jgi:hypothetical protein
LVRAKVVSGLVIERHPGWTTEEQRKIDMYVGQLDLRSDQVRSATSVQVWDRGGVPPARAVLPQLFS